MAFESNMLFGIDISTQNGMKNVEALTRQIDIFKNKLREAQTDNNIKVDIEKQFGSLKNASKALTEFENKLKQTLLTQTNLSKAQSNWDRSSQIAKRTKDVNTLNIALKQQAQAEQEILRIRQQQLDQKIATSLPQQSQKASLGDLKNQAIKNANNFLSGAISESRYDEVAKSINKHTNEIYQNQRLVNQQLKETFSLGNAVSDTMARIKERSAWLFTRWAAEQSIDALVNGFKTLADTETQMAGFAQVMAHGQETVDGMKNSINAFAKSIADVDVKRVASELNLTSKESEYFKRSLNSMQTSLYGLAETYGTTFQEMTESAKLWGRAYKDNATVIALTNSATKLAVADAFDIVGANKALESTIMQWGYSIRNANDAMAVSNKIIDSWTALAHNYTVSAQTMSEANRRFAQSAKEVGVSFDSAQALVAVMARKTQADGGEIGNALKSIFGSIHSSKAIKALEEFGIQVYKVGEDGKRQFRAVDDVLVDLMVHAENSTQNMEGLLKAISGGKWQWNKADAMLDYKEYITALNLSTASFGFTNEQVAMQMDTINRKLKTLSATLQEIATGHDGGLTNMIKGILDIFNSVLKHLNSMPTSILVLQATLSSFWIAQKVGGFDAQKVISGLGDKWRNAVKSVNEYAEAVNRASIANERANATTPTGGNISRGANIAKETSWTAKLSEIFDTFVGKAGKVGTTMGFSAKAVGRFSKSMGAAKFATRELYSALGPIGIGLMAIEGLFELYSSKTTKYRADAEKQMLANAGVTRSEEELNKTLEVSQEKYQHMAEATQYIDTLGNAYANLTQKLSECTEGSEEFNRISDELKLTHETLVNIFGDELAASIESSNGQVDQLNKVKQAWQVKTEAVKKDEMEARSQLIKSNQVHYEKTVNDVKYLHTQNASWLDVIGTMVEYGDLWPSLEVTVLRAAGQITAGIKILCAGAANAILLTVELMRQAWYRLTFQKDKAYQSWSEFEAKAADNASWANEETWADTQADAIQAEWEQSKLAAANEKKMQADKMASDQLKDLAGGLSRMDAGSNGDGSALGGSSKGGSSGSSSSKKSEYKPLTTGEVVFDRLVKDGFTFNQAAGILGNLMLESGGNTLQLEPNATNGTHWGIMQWDSDRWNNFLQFAQRNNSDPNDVRTQADFIYYETHNGGYETNQWNSAVQEAEANGGQAEAYAHSFLTNNERGESETDWQRQVNARKFLNFYSQSPEMVAYFAGKGGAVSWEDQQKKIAEEMNKFFQQQEKLIQLRMEVVNQKYKQQLDGLALTEKLVGQTLESIAVKSKISAEKMQEVQKIIVDAQKAYEEFPKKVGKNEDTFKKLLGVGSKEFLEKSEAEQEELITKLGEKADPVIKALATGMNEARKGIEKLKDEQHKLYVDSLLEQKKATEQYYKIMVAEQQAALDNFKMDNAVDGKYVSGWTQEEHDQPLLDEIARLKKAQYDQYLTETDDNGNPIHSSEEIQKARKAWKDAEKAAHEYSRELSTSVKQSQYDAIHGLIFEGKKLSDIWKDLWKKLAEDALKYFMGIEDKNKSIFAKLIEDVQKRYDDRRSRNHAPTEQGGTQLHINKDLKDNAIALWQARNSVYSGFGGQETSYENQNYTPTLAQSMTDNQQMHVAQMPQLFNADSAIQSKNGWSDALSKLTAQVPAVLNTALPSVASSAVVTPTFKIPSLKLPNISNTITSTVSEANKAIENIPQEIPVTKEKALPSTTLPFANDKIMSFDPVTNAKNQGLQHIYKRISTQDGGDKNLAMRMKLEELKKKANKQPSLFSKLLGGSLNIAGLLGGGAFDGIGKSLGGTWGRDQYSWLFQNLFGLAGFASGGEVDEDQIVRVGENNKKEAIIPVEKNDQHAKNLWTKAGVEMGMIHQGVIPSFKDKELQRTGVQDNQTKATLKYMAQMQSMNQSMQNMLNVIANNTAETSVMTAQPVVLKQQMSDQEFIAKWSKMQRMGQAR